MGGGGRAGGCDGGFVRHRFRLGTPEQDGRFLWGYKRWGICCMEQFCLGAAPWGESARDGCWRQPLRGGKGGRLCRGTHLCHLAGATDCAQYGWGRGGIWSKKRKQVQHLLYGAILFGSSPLGGERTGWVLAAAPARWQGWAALPWDPPLPPRRGYRLRPIWVGQRGDLEQETQASSAFVAPNYGAEGG